MNLLRCPQFRLTFVAARPMFVM
ncbi:protein of unknown function [Azospirillum baldaniorum]|uniref:Uncharacterized protein n=1 Tax=Azospirillum baldaniorum TaxID=1064539 RepID=A0A9P1JPV1_9PROT|nr:protein of unknown function [Azospirillum baldaniorum]